MGLLPCLLHSATALALLAGAPGAQAMGVRGDDLQHVEAVMPNPLPKVPEPQQMREFYVSAAAANRFAIDPASVAVDGGALVRFTLVVTSRGGVRNVTYEAIRCSSAERRLLAVGQVDGGWSPVRDARWQPIPGGDIVNQPHGAMATRFCSGGVAAAREPSELVRLLTRAPPPVF